jgi:hypothetical protein
VIDPIDARARPGSTARKEGFRADLCVGDQQSKPIVTIGQADENGREPVSRQDGAGRGFQIRAQHSPIEV